VVDTAIVLEREVEVPPLLDILLDAVRATLAVIIFLVALVA